MILQLRCGAALTWSSSSVRMRSMWSRSALTLLVKSSDFFISGLSSSKWCSAERVTFAFTFSMSMFNASTSLPSESIIYT